MISTIESWWKFLRIVNTRVDKGFLSNEISIIIGDEYQTVNLNPRSNGINPKICIERKAKCFFEFFATFDIPLFSHQVVKRLPSQQIVDRQGQTQDQLLQVHWAWPWPRLQYCQALFQENIIMVYNWTWMTKSKYL